MHSRSTPFPRRIDFYDICLIDVKSYQRTFDRHERVSSWRGSKTKVIYQRRLTLVMEQQLNIIKICMADSKPHNLLLSTSIQ